MVAMRKREIYGVFINLSSKIKIVQSLWKSLKKL